MKSFASFSQLLLAAGVSASFERARYGGMEVGPIDEPMLAKIAAVSASNATVSGWGTFDQLLDHNDPSLGTFKQRYWWNTQFWKGPTVCRKVT